MDKPPAPSPPATDPMLSQLMQTAQQQHSLALQTEAAGDTASLMARYGARLAAGGSVGTMPLGIADSGGAMPSGIAGTGGTMPLGIGIFNAAGR